MGNTQVPKIRQDKKLTIGITRNRNELNTTFVSQEKVEVLTKPHDSNVFQDLIRIKARPLQIRKLRPAYRAPSFYASPIFNEVQPLINLPLDIEKSKASDTKNSVEKKKRLQEKGDNKMIINQEKIKTLPLAYEVSDTFITAIKYPPYFL